MDKFLSAEVFVVVALKLPVVNFRGDSQASHRGCGIVIRFWFPPTDQPPKDL